MEARIKAFEKLVNAPERSVPFDADMSLFSSSGEEAWLTGLRKAPPSPHR